MAVNESKEGNTNQAGVREGLLEEIVGCEESRTETTRIDNFHQERRESIQKKLWSPCLEGQSQQGQYRAQAQLEQDTQGKNLGRKFQLTVLWRGSQTGTGYGPNGSREAGDPKYTLWVKLGGMQKCIQREV